MIEWGPGPGVSLTGKIESFLPFKCSIALIKPISVMKVTNTTFGLLNSVLIQSAICVIFNSTSSALSGLLPSNKLCLSRSSLTTSGSG